jgi:nitroreductase
MKLRRNIKDILRPLRDIVYTFLGYIYDFSRYFKYAGWISKKRHSVRDYKAVRIYHRIEKSLSFRQRDSNSGWGAAGDLVVHLKKYKKESNSFTYHEKVGLKVLGDFIEVAVAENNSKTKAITEFWEQHKEPSFVEGGVVEKSLADLQGGILLDPEAFFLSRFSVRDFDCKNVSNENIEKAISLALNTPSVCNRQGSFVYCLNTRAEIDKALSLQNGNRGFGHEIPCLLILCADISAFDTAGERYQQWIDGGMFSMSIVWALHSLGLASCCLNWAKGPVDDLRLRKLVKIKNEHTVLMMLAVGMPRENLKVCYSARKPVKEFYKKLD